MNHTKLDKSKLFGFAQVARETGSDLKSDKVKNLTSKIGDGGGEFPGPPVPSRKGTK